MDNDILFNLNKYQRQAVIDDSKACLVNAQVGSGKTTVLIAKVLFVHDAEGVPFDKMVILTFTNKAASEIKERIVKADSSLNENDMAYFGTFHSVALKLLKTILPVEKLGYTSDFTVITPDEEVEMASYIASSYSLRIKYANKIYKRLEMASEGQFTFGNMKYDDDIQKLLTILQQEKKKQNKMNFADLIYNATVLLKESDFKPQWVIIDEFQDSDDNQLEFMRALIGNETKVFAVGDPNQIIYSWRGSNLRVFQRFKEEYNAKELSLPINYRSCSTILDVAKCFLDIDADLNSSREQGSKILIKNHYDPFNEAQYLAGKIKEIVANGDNYKDIAIFYRLQSQSEIISPIFTQAGIPYEVSMRKTLKDIPVLGWFIRILRFCVNTDDKESARQVLTNQMYGEHFSSFEIQNILYGDNVEKSNLLLKMRNFADWCKSCYDITDIYDYLGLDDYINPTASSFEQNREYIKILLNKINEYIKFHNVSIYDGLKDFVDSSALYGVDILKEDLHIDDDTVKLMTLHASKGLEFKYVFIIGANRGLIPMRKKIFTEQDEERRLFFVGITRAKDFLEISYYTAPNNPSVLPGESNYLSMIPKNLVEREDVASTDTDLQTLRREVAAIKAQAETTEDISQDNSIPVPKRKVSHKKYGIGVVISETEETITVQFDGYGEKEFLKAFSELEEVD